MASLLVQALKGAHAEVQAEASAAARLRRLRRLTGVLAAELGAAVALTPYGLRALRVKASLPVAGTPAAADAASSPLGVVLHPAVPYGPKPRQLVDVYVPAGLHAQQQQQVQVQQQVQAHAPAAGGASGAPVVFFVHGGIWATGERWHFGPLAVRLAQEGCVVAVISYSLYPDVLAGEMAGEVLAALLWALEHAGSYGGDARRLSVVGHSAGGHLAALALMMLAQRRHDAAAARRGRLRNQQAQWWQAGALPQRARAASAAASAASSMQQQPQNQQQQQQQPQNQQQPQPQNQQQQQSRNQQQQLDGERLLSLPLPRVFVGMAAVYDVGLHFEFESARGVSGVSTMARACGGAALFGAVSPAVLLRRAVAAAASHQQVQQAQVQQRQQVLQLSAASSGAAEPQLLGELIPLRAGIEPQPGLAPAARATPLTAEASPAAAAAATASSAVPAATLPDASVELARFSAAAASQLPPFILVSSTGDHMVPWHEAAEMALALRAAGVPVKQLIYDRLLHNDLVLDWPVAAWPGAGDAAGDASAGGGASVVSEAGEGAAGEQQQQQQQMHACARDLAVIVTGRVSLAFSSASASDTAAAAAAVAALEDAAGCGAHPAARLFGRGVAGFSSSSLPLSRL